MHALKSDYKYGGGDTRIANNQGPEHLISANSLHQLEHPRRGLALAPLAFTGRDRFLTNYQLRYQRQPIQATYEHNICHDPHQFIGMSLPHGSGRKHREQRNVRGQQLRLLPLPCGTQRYDGKQNTK